jgi:hypothetical protein
MARILTEVLPQTELALDGQQAVLPRFALHGFSLSYLAVVGHKITPLLTCNFPVDHPLKSAMHRTAKWVGWSAGILAPDQSATD